MSPSHPYTTVNIDRRCSELVAPFSSWCPMCSPPSKTFSITCIFPQPENSGQRELKKGRHFIAGSFALFRNMSTCLSLLILKSLAPLPYFVHGAACRSRRSSMPMIASAWSCVNSKLSIVLTPKKGREASAASEANGHLPLATCCLQLFEKK